MPRRQRGGGRSAAAPAQRGGGGGGSSLMERQRGGCGGGGGSLVAALCRTQLFGNPQCIACYCFDPQWLPTARQQSTSDSSDGQGQHDGIATATALTVMVGATERR